MQKTTIAGALTAAIGLVVALLIVFAKIQISPEIVTGIGFLGIAIIAFFCDPNSIRSVPAAIALIFEKIIMVANYILSKYYPEIGWTPILAFLQPILIFIFSYVIQDPNKNVIQARAPNA